MVLALEHLSIDLVSLVARSELVGLVALSVYHSSHAVAHHIIKVAGSKRPVDKALFAPTLFAFAYAAAADAAVWKRNLK